MAVCQVVHEHELVAQHEAEEDGEGDGEEDGTGVVEIEQ
jgi:hypothetical protein